MPERVSPSAVPAHPAHIFLLIYFFTQCSSGSSQTHYVAEDDFELVILLCLWRARITAVTLGSVCCQGIQPKALHMLGKPLLYLLSHNPTLQRVSAFMAVAAVFLVQLIIAEPRMLS